MKNGLNVVEKGNNPYVVSADVNLLMQQWARKNGFTVPKEQYFLGVLKDLEAVLSQYFDSVQVVPEKFIVSGMVNMANHADMPVISLDRAYVAPGLKNLAGFIDVTRTVDERLENRGLSERPGTPPIDTQLNEIVKNLRTKKVALLDDVLFEGGTHATVAEWLKQRGIIVEKVLVGIAIKEGAERLAQSGITVQSLLSYNSVTDEVCERDFIAGAPLSGRTVVTYSGQAYGAPYFSPFGKPEKWASIPQADAVNFSFFCLAHSILLWKEIERLSGTNISTEQIPKPIFGLEPNKSIVTALKNVRK